jgi:hypothetical protein
VSALLIMPDPIEFDHRREIMGAVAGPNPG